MNRKSDRGTEYGPTSQEKKKKNPSIDPNHSQTNIRARTPPPPCRPLVLKEFEKGQEGQGKPCRLEDMSAARRNGKSHSSKTDKTGGSLKNKTTRQGKGKGHQEQKRVLWHGKVSMILDRERSTTGMGWVLKP